MQNVKEIDFQVVTNQAGEKTAVLLPIAAFEEIMEDLDDLAKLAERRDEATISHEDLKEQLKADGLL
jgi:PHD/YefM family antitoxin component YafN of YafNO toxin-antitoxin module